MLKSRSEHKQIQDATADGDYNHYSARRMYFIFRVCAPILSAIFVLVGEKLWDPSVLFNIHR